MSPEPAVPHILTSGACQRYTVEREAAHALSERCLLPHPIGPYRLLVARAAMAFILVAAALWGLPWPSVAPAADPVATRPDTLAKPNVFTRAG